MKALMISISLITFTGYLIFIYLRFGVLPNISESFYHIKNKFLFILWTLGTALPIMVLGESGWSFFSGAFLIVVGVASDARSTEMTGRVHSICAKGTVALGFAFLVFVLHLWWLVLIAVAGIALMNYLKIKNDVWWIECLAYYTIISGFIIK